MLFRRCSAGISVLATLACVVTLIGITPAATADQGARTKVNKVHRTHHTVGRPPMNSPVRHGVLFNYPNRSRAEQVSIRKRVLHTIKSTWGGRRDRLHAAHSSNGTIRIATWTFKDMKIARALYAAHRRGVSVQIIAAKDPNKTSGPWKWLRKRLHTRPYHKRHKETANRWSFARNCRGSCRGRGGTAHSKYLLFHNVGSAHTRTITMQTSANLTTTAFQGQWNEATTSMDRRVYAAFSNIFRKSRRDRPVRGGAYRHYASGRIQSMFFPRPKTSAHHDPVMRTLSHVHCTGARSGGDAHGHTRIRIIQYAMYDTRGVWIAKRLRALWKAGCNIKIIFSAISRPVFKILRSHSGHGPIPMKQSVVRNVYGDIVKYNHSKWMTITGHWAGSTRVWLVFSGSANWSNLAFSCDEQMQEIHSYGYTKPHLKAFAKTWRQRSSGRPRPGPISPNARMLAGARIIRDIPQEPTFGRGVYKFMAED
jgi:hypothetical protein